MQTRQILLLVTLVVVAFAATFGLASAGGGKEPAASRKAPSPAATIEVATVAVRGDAPPAVDLPPLRVPEAPERDEPTAADSSPTAPSTDTAAPETGTTPPSAEEPAADPAPAATSQPDPAPDTGGGLQTGGGDD